MHNQTAKTPRAIRQKRPHHTVVTRAYCFPMEVPAKQHERFMAQLTACWRLRNNLVNDRLTNRLFCRSRKQQGLKPAYLNRADQYRSLAKYVRQDTALSKVHSQVRQNVAVRVDEGYKRFFDALKEGKTSVHPPRFLDFRKYRSFTFPQYGSAAHIKNSTLHLSGLGDFRIHDYRKVRGKKKTVTIKMKQGRWWCIVTAETQEKDILPQVPSEGRMNAGIDPGLSVLMTDSYGETYDPPKAWHDNRRKLRMAQKKMSRQFEARKRSHAMRATLAKSCGITSPVLRDIPYSNRLTKQIKKVAKIHTKVERIREHHHKKNAAIIADRYNMVAVEDHGAGFMTRNRKLAKLASDRATSSQKLRLISKLGGRYIKAPTTHNGVGNSQVCVCGALVPKALSERVHACPECGLVAGRDHMAANVISANVFGFVSLSLCAPAAGQEVVRRGEDKNPAGESCRIESHAVVAALESSVKRRPLVQVRHTTGAEATVEGKTASHRRTGLGTACRCADEPKTAAITGRNTVPSDSMHALNSV